MKLNMENPKNVCYKPKWASTDLKDSQTLLKSTGSWPALNPPPGPIFSDFRMILKINLATIVPIKKGDAKSTPLIPRNYILSVS